MITGTHINYYHVCARKLWLFANGIQMEHTSELVGEGKLIHEFAYPQRSEKYSEIELDGIKIDYYDAKNKIVHEIKKSDKAEEAHRWQVKYYLFVLEKKGITGVKAVLEYPTLRLREEIELQKEDRMYLQKIMEEIETICGQETMPPRAVKKICRTCSYYDFCWSGEES